MKKNRVYTIADFPEKKEFIYLNVVLTFATLNESGDAQEMFDLKLPVKRNESSALDFINKNLFNRVVSKCDQYGRRPQELIKISIASDWTLFEKLTWQSGLHRSHSCNWRFGNGRDDLDLWEIALMDRYGFGIDIDMNEYLSSSRSMVIEG